VEKSTGSVLLRRTTIVHAAQGFVTSTSNRVSNAPDELSGAVFGRGNGLGAAGG
jgi:hypothetical protein